MAITRFNDVYFIVGNLPVLQLPASSSTELGHDSIAFSKKSYVKVDVMNRLIDFQLIIFPHRATDLRRAKHRHEARRGALFAESQKRVPPSYSFQ